MTGDVVLRVEGLTKRFGGLTAVDDLSFRLHAGEILGVIGPNGAGKTTVFDCLMGIYSVTDGRVYFQGEEITGRPTHEIVNRGVARVSQESNPIASMTARENIELFTLPNSVLAFDSGGDRSEVEAIAASVAIEDQLDSRPGSMSHADRRRLEIAKAIATDPDVLLLDEPFAGLNQAEIRELSDQIRSFHEQGVPVIVVDHNMKGLLALVDRVVVMNEGTTLTEGSPEAVADDQRVQKAYLAGSTEREVE